MHNSNDDPGCGYFILMLAIVLVMLAIEPVKMAFHNTPALKYSFLESEATTVPDNTNVANFDIYYRTSIVVEETSEYFGKGTYTLELYPTEKNSYFKVAYDNNVYVGSSVRVTNIVPEKQILILEFVSTSSQPNYNWAYYKEPVNVKISGPSDNPNWQVAYDVYMDDKYSIEEENGTIKLDNLWQGESVNFFDANGDNVTDKINVSVLIDDSSHTDTGHLATMRYFVEKNSMVIEQHNAGTTELSFTLQANPITIKNLFGVEFLLQAQVPSGTFAVIEK